MSTPTETQVPSPSTSLFELAVLISENSPDIVRFIVDNTVFSSNILTAHYISLLDTAITRNEGIMYEAIGGLDFLAIAAISSGFSPDYYIEAIKEAITSSRVITSHELLINDEVGNNIYFASKEELKKLLDANPHLLTVYLLSIAVRIT